MGKKEEKGKSNGATEQQASSEESPFNIDAELKKLYVDALASGLPEKTVRQCFLSEVYVQSKVQNSSRWRLWSVIVLPVVLGVVFRGNITDYLHTQMYESMCLVDTNMFIMEMARPIANCSAMCAGLSNGVPVVENITAQDFLVNHVRGARPCW